jgi:hypothetical protein
VRTNTRECYASRVLELPSLVLRPSPTSELRRSTTCIRPTLACARRGSRVDDPLPGQSRRRMALRRPRGGRNLRGRRATRASLESNLPSMDINLPSIDPSLPSTGKNLPSIDPSRPSTGKNLPSIDPSLPSTGKNLPSTGISLQRSASACLRSIQAGHRHRSAGRELEGTSDCKLGPSVSFAEMARLLGLLANLLGEDVGSREADEGHSERKVQLFGCAGRRRQTIAGFCEAMVGVRPSEVVRKASKPGCSGSMAGRRAKIAGRSRSMAGRRAKIAGRSGSMAGRRANIAGCSGSMAGHSAKIAGRSG